MNKDKFCIATVAAIIERKKKSRTEVLLQERWKPIKDKKHSGKFEFPGGRLDKSDKTIFEALRREVKEETGLSLTAIKPKEVIERSYDKSYVFPAFCMHHLPGTYMGAVFVCKAKGKLKKQEGETRNHRWVGLKELEEMLKKPKNFYSYDLPALKYYLKQKKKGRI